MKVRTDCVHCYLKQAVSCMNQAGTDEDTQHQVLYKLMDEIKKYSRENTPAENSTEVLLKTHELIQNHDPYKKAKKYSNDLAMGLYSGLERMMHEAQDKLDCALRLAVAGNVIDLGIHRDFDIAEAVKHSMEIGFSIDHSKEFKDRVIAADKVLILGDNSGEIVFDKILVKHMIEMGKEVVYVVKEKPVLNDTTMEDAVYVGMDKLTRVITNGSGYLGTCMSKVSDEFLNEFNHSDIVLAKGQANYESLEAEERSRGKVFFLLRLKCDLVAENAGGKMGDMAFFTV